MLPHDLRSPKSKSPVTYTKVLVVEGSDSFEFFKAVLRQLNLLADIEIRNFGGIGNLTGYLKSLKETAGFKGRAVSLGVIRDAESDATKAFQSVCGSLSQAQLAVPARPAAIAEGTPTVSVFVLPDCASPGMLETLCLHAVGRDPSLPCVDQYFQCVQEQGLTLPNNMTKARLHAFLSSRERPNLLLGQAAHAGYFPWDSPAFDQLKQFLHAL